MNEELLNIFDYKPSEDEDYYKILGCDELSSKEQITAEYKARVLNCHPDKHPSNPEKAAEFERIQTAKDVLCDDEKRANYDKWRHAGIAMPFKKWCNMRGAVHTSMHWTTPKKETMIDHKEHVDSPELPEESSHTATDSSYTHSYYEGHTDVRKDYRSYVPWERDEPSETLRKFRNYEI